LSHDPFAERAEGKAEVKAEAKTKARAGVSLRDLMRQWDHQHLVNRRASYATDSLRRIELGFALWLDRPAADLNRREVRAVLDQVAERGKGAAYATASSITALFSWAARHDIIQANPLASFALPVTLPPRERCLNEGECRRVYAAAASLGWPSGHFIRLLLLTAARRAEIAGLRWSEIVDTPSGPTISLPPERTKTGRVSGGRLIPLSGAAAALLGQCPRVLTASDLVFTRGRVPIAGFTVTKAKLDAALARDGGPPMAQWVPHDLRRSMVSALAARGHSALALDALLGHAPTALSAIARIYQRDRWEQEQRAAVEHWARLMSSAGEEVSSEVVPFEKRAAE
jgi:integrase